MPLSFTWMRCGLTRNFCRDCDQVGSPRAPMSFAKGILPAAIVFVTLPVLNRQSFGRNLERGTLLEWTDNGLPYSHQQVVSGNMQIQVKQVGHVTMITQTIWRQATLHLLVAVFRFTTVGVFVIRSLRKDLCARTIRNHRTTVRALSVHFALHDGQT